MKSGQKEQLVQEAGGKCANPGCSNWRTQIHHIQHWSVYKAHDSNHMIAVCPACHDHIHYTGGITDELLYKWKGIPRTNHRDVEGYIYIEPSAEIRVLTGTMCVSTSNAEAAVFTLSNSNKFAFKISGDGDIFLASCSIKDLSGAYLVRMFDGYFKVKRDEAVQINHRPGKIRVTALDAKRYLPAWTITTMRRAIPDFVRNNITTVFELEVIRPGVVRLQGAFVANDAVLAITLDKIYVLRPELNGPIALVGGGERTEIRLSGPVTRIAFGL
ncbi:MAG: HNH endonuclease [Acetobacteraceae bacterium]|nr:HNH endonuclease [Acetobacteraceae bacterium]